jgi:hypothetical protein
MVVPMVAVGLAGLLVGWLAYMLLTPGSVTEEIEREIGWIRREAEWGWNDRRICEHHPDFCVCQVAYLRAHARAPS